jgi:hypothetical protein
MTRNAEHMHLPLIERLTEQLKDSGTPAATARDMALSSLRDRGHVHQHSEALTAEGEARDQMGAGGRAIDRAAKASGRRASEYGYNQHSNRATLKRK